MKLNYNSHALIFCLSLSLVLFLVLVVGVLRPLPLFVWDDILGHMVRIHIPLEWLVPMLIITNIASPAILGSVVVVAYSVLLWFRRGYYDLVLLSAISGAAFSTYFVKTVLNTPRPEAALISSATASFPSGHTAMATAVFLSIAYAFRHEIRHKFVRWGFEFVCFALVVAIAVSRMYLGAHRPSEVVAGFLLGVCWVTLSLLVIKPPVARLK